MNGTGRHRAGGEAPATIGGTTPLLALDAVALDLETTGLDPARARAVEIAALRMDPANSLPADVYLRRVNPGERIPPSATAIHGIDDAAVSEAPRFDTLWPELINYIADTVVIGHSIGFDLAVLKRECERANSEWKRPRALDTRLLAEFANPNLPGYSLDQLSAWLGIEPEQRHSAYGDALTAARIFYALLPKLRERGVRSLAEAENACRTLVGHAEEQHHAGWLDVLSPPRRSAANAPAVARIDVFPYRHRVSEVMSAPARLVSADTTLGAAIDLMMKHGVSSLFVSTDVNGQEMGARPAATGIVTERDVLRALASSGAQGLSFPVAQVMSRPLEAVPSDTLVYRAIGRMNRLKFRHLGVIDRTGTIVGALSARDLLRVRAHDAVSLSDELDEAGDVVSLAKAWAKLPYVVKALRSEGVSGREAATVISFEVAAVTRRAAVLAGQRLRDDGRGPPPCPYAVAVLGSAGREESLLAMDQDNALVFAEGELGSPADAWIEQFAREMTGILDELGVPYCKGGVMPSNPQWRGSLATWRGRVADWIDSTRPEAILSVDIFFDLKAVHGELKLVDSLWEESFQAAHSQPGFAKRLAQSAGQVAPGTGIFGRFITKQGRIDLKRTGLFGIVTFARALAIRHAVVERSTRARLLGIKARGLGGQQDLDQLSEFHDFLLGLILDQQLHDIEEGLPPSNAVLVSRLSRTETAQLRRALKAVEVLPDLARDLFY